MAVVFGGRPAGPVRMSFPVLGHLAATATELVSLAVFDQDLYISTAGIMPTTAVSGAATNYTNYNLLSDATEKANIDFDNGEDLVAHTLKSFTSFAAFTLSAGDHLNLQIEKVSSGLLIPATSIDIVAEFRG